MTQDTEQVTQEAKEMATHSQKEELNISPDVGEAIAESKKYRNRAQKAEFEKAELKKEIENMRTERLEEQNDYKTLADERKSIIDEQNVELDVIRTEIKAEVETLLSDFSDNDRETFKELSLKQLRAVHSKLISKQNIPNVDTTPAGEYQGYNNLIDAAKDVSQGRLDKKSYAKIKEAFTSKISRA
tara:strand:- start:306 stop:863 length:558 start_codon:yes stop_codon:yes gene_type:complete